MVVDDDDRRAVAPDGLLEHLADADERAVDAADVDRVNLLHAVLGVEANHAQVLLVEVRHLKLHELRGVGRRFDLEAFFNRITQCYVKYYLILMLNSTLSESATSYAGLAPQLYQSGSSVRGRSRIGHFGNAHLRRCLYLATFYERLRAAGKPAKVARCVAALLAPRVLDADQCYVLRSFVERDGSMRSAALFALSFWAGCRVSDVSCLRVEHTHITSKASWLHVDHKGGKSRDIYLYDEARRPIADHLASNDQCMSSPFVF